MTETRLSFKKMCARFETTPRTLRHYEYIEMLPPGKTGECALTGHGKLPA